MSFVVVISLCVLPVLITANTKGDYCQVLEEYESFKSTLDDYLASRNDLCEERHIRTDCYKIKEEFPDATDGVYRIKPLDGKPSFLAYCQMEGPDGGWLVIQRRQDGSEDFYRTWFEYMDGFGNLTREFWLGNEKIHRLTSQGKYELRVDLQNKEDSKYAEYSYFRVGNMSEFYNLTIDGYSGSAPDGLSYHNNSRFSARNLELDSSSGRHCAQEYHGAWWYKSCHNSNLNGLYTGSGNTGVRWLGLSNSKKTTMKIRPVH